ncbi:MAG TPA: nucleotidyltransferase domain-containing protein [Acidimicrobiales bacterium]|nr:nucleotidyltransferase domain-containing protein [Acidimicrobiales bacterium]
MDFLRPVEAVIPGAQGKLLAVFAQTSTALSVRTAARLSGVSIAQTSRILPDLATLGILESTDVPPSTVYRLIEGNVAARAVILLARSRDLVLAELGEAARSMELPPVSVVVFGSFARGDAGPDSDVDVVIVHESGVESTPIWMDEIAAWRDLARRLTGNEVEVVEVDERDIGTRLRSRRPVWSDIRREGIVIFGRTLDDMQIRQSKTHHVA